MKMKIDSSYELPWDSDMLTNAPSVTLTSSNFGLYPTGWAENFFERARLTPFNVALPTPFAWPSLQASTEEEPSEIETHPQNRVGFFSNNNRNNISTPTTDTTLNMGF